MATPGQTLDAPALRTSFELVLTRAPGLTSRLFDKPFGRYPAAKSLFSEHDRSPQERLLGETLGAVIDHLEDAAWLDETLTSLGRRLADHGVTPTMYGWVGEALLATLAEVLGPEWSPELRAAWTEAHGVISELMLRGAGRRAA